jgi:hypothetical protein
MQLTLISFYTWIVVYFIHVFLFFNTLPIYSTTTERLTACVNFRIVDSLHASCSGWICFVIAHTFQGEGEVKILGRLARHWYDHGESDSHGG